MKVEAGVHKQQQWHMAGIGARQKKLIMTSARKGAATNLRGLSSQDKIFKAGVCHNYISGYKLLDLGCTLLLLLEKKLLFGCTHLSLWSKSRFWPCAHLRLYG